VNSPIPAVAVVPDDGAMDGSAALVRARAALADGDWEAARDGFAEALAHEESGEALDGLAQASFSSGDYPAAITHGERAFAAYRAAGEDARAASCARFVGFLYGVVHGDGAVAGGWMGRAVRLIEAAGDCPERARIELTRAVIATDPATREQHLAAAEDVATRHGLHDLLFDAMSQRGVHLVAAGAVDAGMALLDEALAAVAGGEVGDLVSIGAMYCKMLLACELTSDVRRAEDWLAQARRFVDRTARLPIGAICRTHYSGVLVAAGRWGEAERELSVAVTLYDRSYRALRGAAQARLAALRVRQGRLAEAAELLDECGHDAHAVHPRVELHLARGEAELAAQAARRVLREHPGVELHAPLRTLLVRAELARGDVAAARAVAAPLREAAAGRGAALVRALGAQAGGLVAAAEGDPDAIGRLEVAVAGFGRLGLPLEEARARIDLAGVLAGTRPAVATAEARAALERFRELGAARDVDAATSVLRGLGVRGHSGPRGAGTLTGREEDVLDLLGEGLSNTEIAARLHLSRRTVEHHVSNVLAKLGLTRRAEASAWAARRGRGLSRSRAARR